MSCFLDNLVLIFVQSFAKTDCPIFFLTAKTSDLDKLSGFSHGADDYITKPFNPLEVVLYESTTPKTYEASYATRTKSTIQFIWQI